MGKEVFSFIAKQMKDRKYFSMSVDSTPDVSHTDQSTVMVRDVLDRTIPKISAVNVTQR